MFSGLARAGGEFWDRTLDFYERSKLLLGVCTVLLLVGLGVSEGGQHIEAMVIGLLLPVFAAFSAARARHAGQNGNGLVAIIVVGMLISSEILLSRTLFEPKPLGVATLSNDAPSATLDIAAQNVEVETLGDLGNVSSAEGVYSYDLSRGANHVAITGEIVRTASKARRRSRLVPVLGHTYDTERELVALPGSGPVSATLNDLRGTVSKTIEVRILPAPFGGRLWLWLLATCAAVAVLIDAVTSERRSLGHASWLAASAAFTLNLLRHYSQHDPMGATVGSLFFAVGAAFGAWVLSALLSKISGRARHAQ